MNFEPSNMICNTLLYQNYCVFETLIFNLKCIGFVTITLNLKSFLTLIYLCFVINSGQNNTWKTISLCFTTRNRLQDGELCRGSLMGSELLNHTYAGRRKQDCQHKDGKLSGIQVVSSISLCFMYLL